MKFYFSLVCVLLGFLFPALGYSAGFANFYGGPSRDKPGARAGNPMCKTSDGGYILIGTTGSFGGEVGTDIWVVKLLSSGEIEWQKSYDGESSFDPCTSCEGGTSIQETSDGGYLATGIRGYSRIWILKLDSSGEIQWQKDYDRASGAGTYVGQPFSFQQTEDGGYIVLGMSDQYGVNDFTVLRLNGTGEISWAKSYSGEDGGAEARSIQQTQDGGFIITGATSEFVMKESEKECAHSYGNAWILKITSTGVIEWEKAYGGTGCDIANTIRQTSDGGYIVAGSTDFGGATDDEIAWVFKLTSSGVVEWSKTYGDLSLPPFSIEETSDGGYIVGGPLLIKLDSVGGLEWQKLYGGNSQNYTIAAKIIESGYVILGYTELFGAGNGDFWLFEVDANGNKPCCNLACSAKNMAVKSGPVSFINSTATINDPEFIIRNTTANPKVTSAEINTQCPNSMVEDVVIQNTAVSSNAICECSDNSSITTGKALTIEDGAHFTFKAPSVKIQSGFQAENGSVINMKQE